MTELTDALVAEIHHLQEGWTPRHEEERLAEILTSVTGPELTELKNAINRRDDHHDLEELVFGDIDDESIRERILTHIASAASDLGRVGVKVLSDIDDTVFPMIHEQRYPRGHIPVPGSLAFLQALDDGPVDNPLSRGDLTFVTARPEVAFGLVERSSKDALRKAGITSSSVLAGGLAHLHSKDAMADGKLANIWHYRLLFPEYGVVFVGDSGQGDVLVGQRVREEHPEACPAVFIHDVVATPPRGADSPRRARHPRRRHLRRRRHHSPRARHRLGRRGDTSRRRDDLRARRGRVGEPAAGGGDPRARPARRRGGWSMMVEVRRGLRGASRPG